MFDDLKWDVLGTILVAAIFYPLAFLVEKKFGL